MAFLFLIIFIFIASTRMENNRSTALESPRFVQSVTLGESETSFNPLLNEMMVLYLRNHGIQVKELTFKDPTRLPLALEHQIIDAYWEVRTESPSEAVDQAKQKDGPPNLLSHLFVPHIHESKRTLLQPHFNKILERMTRDKWVELQKQVDTLGEDVSEVAKQFLVQENLIR